MLNKQGPLAIAGLIAVFAAVHFGLAGERFDPSVAGPVMLGGIAYLLMTCSIVLATRAPFLEGLFGGLDRMYQVHKFCGIFSLLLILPHFFLAPKELPPGADPAVNADLAACFDPGAALFDRFYITRLGKKKYHLFELS